jgi:hypothetical protein
MVVGSCCRTPVQLAAGDLEGRIAELEAQARDAAHASEARRLRERQAAELEQVQARFMQVRGQARAGLVVLHSCHWDAVAPGCSRLCPRPRGAKLALKAQASLGLLSLPRAGRGTLAAIAGASGGGWVVQARAFPLLMRCLAASGWGRRPAGIPSYLPKDPDLCPQCAPSRALLGRSLE